MYQKRQNCVILELTKSLVYYGLYNVLVDYTALGLSFHNQIQLSYIFIVNINRFN